MNAEKAGRGPLARRIANRIGRPFGVNPFPRAFANPLADDAVCAAELFNDVFRKNYWGSSQSRSGVGSETVFTAKYRAGLSALLRTRGFRRIFDAPCGDLNWMVRLIEEIGIDFVGGDISSLVIEEARRRHQGLDLRVFDVTSDPFPETDIWHCRDCLFHLPFADIQRALENFTRSMIPYALLTTHRAHFVHRNLDVGIGGFRYLDLERPPVSLPRPEVRIADFQAGRDFPRYTGLWQRAEIAAAAARWTK